VDPRTPVLIGSGQRTYRADSLAEARSPIALMAEAVELAVADAGLRHLPDIDLFTVVNTLSFRSADPARCVATALGVSPAMTAVTTAGGNAPQALVNHVAASIQQGELEFVVLTGGEARRTQRRGRAAGTKPWPDDPDPTPADEVIGEAFVLSSPAELAREIWLPIQIYPLFESALRAASGRTPSEHQAHLAALWARFATVAADNPFAWNRTAPSATDIANPGPKNRMIGWPYPKLMNSNNDVDQSAALLMCSVEKATELGVPRDRWVFPVSGTDCHEHPFISNRWTFTETPAIRMGGRLALELAGLGIDDIGVIDLYSCFPSAVQLGATSLGLSLDRQLTRTGGLSFAGGPWNNYSMHAIATVMNDLRNDPTANGLVWANGGFASKHAFSVYRTHPPAEGYRYASPQAMIDELPQRPSADAADAAGAAVVEAYTVMHDRDGQPERAIASCLLGDGRRAWGTSLDGHLAAALTDGEWVGRTVTLKSDGVLVA
jgi:acetyl-CoA C-acetyltransferase